MPIEYLHLELRNALNEITVLIPVYNIVLMQILETKDDACSVKYTPWLSKHIIMNVHHQISTTSIFHHETNVLLIKKNKKKQRFT